MRRFISSILAMLVLLLSCLPCNDVAAAPSVKTITQSIPQDKTQDDCHELDTCSPFCTCACCAGFILPLDSPPAPLSTLTYAQQPFALWPPRALPEVSFPIWQPPQLS